MLAGLTVGHAQDASANSGVTAVLAPQRATAAVEVRGGAPGTRETDLLGPANTVEAVDGVVLAGGSVFGLAAADGAVRALQRAGKGIDAAGHRIPILPAAILFDRPAAGWNFPESQPEDLPVPDYAALGEAAAVAAGDWPAEGTVGAGFGAVAGGWKGGLGLARQHVAGLGADVAALVAANPWGSVTLPGTDHFWAWWSLDPDEPGDPHQGPPPEPDWARDRLTPGLLGGGRAPSGREATTLAVVATDAVLTPAQAQRLAIMAGDGVSRAIRPCHSPFDGDIAFALATGASGVAVAPFGLAALGAAAADQLSRAIVRAVATARAVPGGPPAWRDSNA